MAEQVALGHVVVVAFVDDRDHAADPDRISGDAFHDLGISQDRLELVKVPVTQAPQPPAAQATPAVETKA